MYSQSQSSVLWSYPRPRPGAVPAYGRRRNPSCFQCQWMQSLAVNAHCYLRYDKGKWNAKTIRRKDSIKMLTSCALNFTSFTVKPGDNSKKGCETKNFLQSMTFYFISRLLWSNSLHWIKRIVELSPSCLLMDFCNSSSPFACVSNSINKPVPLQLDVSFPSFQDIRWSLSRLYYLFNMQLERNIAMFFVALLVACFSFVIVGGFLFYKFRFCRAMHRRKNGPPMMRSL